MMKKKIDLIFRIAIAFILVQSTYYKFTFHPEAIHTFVTVLGLGEVGMLGLGIVEITVGALLLIPKTALYGVVLSLGLMSGALFSHFTKLGIVQMWQDESGKTVEDGGALFTLAVIAFVLSASLVLMRKTEVMQLVGKITKR